MKIKGYAAVLAALLLCSTILFAQQSEKTNFDPVLGKHEPKNAIFVIENTADGTKLEHNPITGKARLFDKHGNLIKEIQIKQGERAWGVKDPKAEKYNNISPYAYVANNPLKFIDPNGKDIYRYDDKTGDFMLHKKTDDKFDQVGKFKYDKKTGEYTLKTNRKGEAKTKIDNIEKGILSNGINFKNNDNVIAVGGEGQATVAGVEKFVVEMSEMVGKEIGGYEISNKGQNEVNKVYVSAYSNNKPDRAITNFNLNKIGVKTLNDIDIMVHFHTHLSIYPKADRLSPSGLSLPGGDMQFKKHQSNYIKKFIILTQGYSPIEY